MSEIDRLWERAAGLALSLDAALSGMSDRYLFEEWMVERFRAQLASEEYRATAEYAYMRAQWEQEG